MGLLNIYAGIPSKSAFLHNFNEDQMGMARKFYDQLDMTATIVFIVMIILGCLISWAYYKPFNNAAGRHYKPRYWVFFLIGCIVACALMTWGVEIGCISSKLSGVGKYETILVIDNALYSFFPYFVASVVFCNGKTNAYPLFKIK